MADKVGIFHLPAVIPNRGAEIDAFSSEIGKLSFRQLVQREVRTEKVVS